MMSTGVSPFRGQPGCDQQVEIMPGEREAHALHAFEKIISHNPHARSPSTFKTQVITHDLELAMCLWNRTDH